MVAKNIFYEIRNRKDYELQILNIKTKIPQKNQSKLDICR